MFLFTVKIKVIYNYEYVIPLFVMSPVLSIVITSKVITSKLIVVSVEKVGHLCDPHSGKWHNQTFIFSLYCQTLLWPYRIKPV
jgi:hypothetical protein